jgi:hypothetical protein
MASWIRFVFLPLFSFKSIPVFLASDEFICQGVSHESINVSDDDLSATGISIKQTLRDMKLEYCILGKKEVRVFWLHMK